MRRDTIFRMASTTKPVAAAAAMILVDEWLPELADRQVLQSPDGPLDETRRRGGRSPYGICSPPRTGSAWT